MRCTLLLIVLFVLAPGMVAAKSVLSPKHSGLDAPGHVHNMPMPSHTDAYGYGLTDKIPEEKKARHRPRPGAYGGPPKAANPRDNRLPGSSVEKSRPLWGF